MRFAAHWSFAWQLLGGNAATLFKRSEGKAFRQRWLISVYQTATLSPDLLALLLGQQSSAR